MEYRSDIDGLRALAVIPVVLFHTHTGILPGGFAGVDVFFVISGFLITSLLLEDMNSIPSAIGKFYERRIRRLIPPLLPVLVFSVIAGWFLLKPDDYKEFSDSMLSSLAYVSNFFFLFQADYFDGPSHLKPLLHTWSLSVEEQFYLLFPFFVLTLKRFGIKYVALFYLLIVILSFAANIYFSQMTSPSNAFFNSVGRFFEIAFGGLLASWRPNISNTTTKNTFAFIGAALIIFTYIYVTEESQWPGYVVLLPTLGTVFIILAKDAVINRLLSLKPVVWVGLISYSIYLWHWPIFVYIQHYFVTPKPHYFVYGIIATLTLSVASYFIIETPIRKRKIIKNTKNIWLFYVVSMLLLASIAATISLEKGFRMRMKGDVKDYISELERITREWGHYTLRHKCWVDHRVKLQPVIDRCIDISEDRPNVLLVGDSHSAHLYPGLSVVFPDVNFNLIAVDSCRLISNEDIKNKRPACHELSSYLDSLDEHEFDTVIISVREISDNNILLFKQQVKQFSKKSQVYVVGPVSYYKPRIPDLYPMLLEKNSPEDIQFALDEAIQKIRFDVRDIMKKELTNIANVTLVDPLQEICPSNVCKHYDTKGYPLYLDASHLTPRASRELVANLFLNQKFLFEFKSTESNEISKAILKGDSGRIDKNINQVTINGTDDWFSQAKTKILSRDEEKINFEMPNDGRLTYQLKLPFAYRPPTEFKFSALFNVDSSFPEMDEKSLDIVLQSGCEHNSNEGRGYPVKIKTGLNQIEKAITFYSAESECVMVRVWNKNKDLIKGSIEKIKLEVSALNY